MVYVYEMSPLTHGPYRPATVGGRSISTVRGLICAMTLEDWGGSVLPHEYVMRGPVEDRLALLRATRTHLSPVYGTIDGPDAMLEGFLRSVAEAPAPFEAVDEQGVRHRMWPAPGDAASFEHSLGSTCSSPTATIATRRPCSIGTSAVRRKATAPGTRC